MLQSWLWQLEENLWASEITLDVSDLQTAELEGTWTDLSKLTSEDSKLTFAFHCHS